MHVVFDNEDLEEYTQLYLAPASARDRSPSEVFRTMLHFVAESFNLGKLDLEVDGRRAWGLFENKAAGAYGGDEVD